MNFQRELLKNFLTVGGLKYSGLFFSFIGQAFISRIITPDEYGVHAIGILYYGLFSLFLDAGITMAIIRFPETDDFQRGIKGLSILIGLGLGLILFTSAFFIGTWYDQTDITYLLWVYAIIILITSIALPHEALLSKRKAFSFISRVGLLTTVVQLLTTYLLALAGYSYWSLVWPLLLGAMLKVGFFNQKVSIPISNVKVKDLVFVIRESASLIKNITAFRVLSYASRNADNFYLSRLEDKSVLGAYNRAFNFSRLPVTLLTGILSNIQLPMFQSLVDEGKKEQVKTEFISYLKVLGALGAPIVVVFHLVPYELSTLIWGDQWTSVGEYLLPLSILIPTTLMLNSCGNMFVLYQGEKKLVYNSIVSALALIVGATIGSFISVKAMIIGLIMGSLLGSLPVTMYLGCYRTFEFTVLEILDTWAFNFLVVVALLVAYAFHLGTTVIHIVLGGYTLVSGYVVLRYIREFLINKE